MSKWQILAKIGINGFFALKSELLQITFILAKF